MLLMVELNKNGI